MATRKFGGAELLKAVIARLAADDLTSSYSVYNYVPDTASPPYVVAKVLIGTRSALFGSRDEEAEENKIYDVLIDANWNQYIYKHRICTGMHKKKDYIDEYIWTNYKQDRQLEFF